MKYYVIIDTSVLVSAMLARQPDSATVLLIEKMLVGNLTPVYSKKILQEYCQVLSRPKFKFPQDKISVMLFAIQKYGVCFEPTPTGVILPDMKDLPFYEVVLETQENHTYLVTGNLKHFPSVPFIVTARQMLDIINNDRN